MSETASVETGFRGDNTMLRVADASRTLWKDIKGICVTTVRQDETAIGTSAAEKN